MGKGKGGKSVAFCRLKRGRFFLKVENIVLFRLRFFLKKINNFFGFRVSPFFITKTSYFIP